RSAEIQGVRHLHLTVVPASVRLWAIARWSGATTTRIGQILHQDWIAHPLAPVQAKQWNRFGQRIPGLGHVLAHGGRLWDGRSSRRLLKESRRRTRLRLVRQDLSCTLQGCRKNTSS